MNARTISSHVSSMPSKPAVSPDSVLDINLFLIGKHLVILNGLPYERDRKRVKRKIQQMHDEGVEEAGPSTHGPGDPAARNAASLELTGNVTSGEGHADVKENPPAVVETKAQLSKKRRIRKQVENADEDA